MTYKCLSAQNGGKSLPQNGFYRLGYDDQTLVYSEINALDLNQMLRGTQSIYGTFSFNNKTPGFSHVDNRYVSFYGNASYNFRQPSDREWKYPY